MYKNRLSLQSKKISPNTHPHLFIRRSEMPYEERIKNVDHVCALLTESRFGTDFYYEPVPDFRDLPDAEPIDFCDLHGFTAKAQRAQSNTLDLPRGRRAFRVKHSQGRTECKRRERKDRRECNGILTSLRKIFLLCVRGALRVKNSLGRGSPKFSGTHVSEPGAIATGFFEATSQGRTKAIHSFVTFVPLW